MLQSKIEINVVKKITGSVHFWLPISGIVFFFLFLASLAFINTGSFRPLLDFWSIIREGFFLLVDMVTSMYFVYYSIQFFNKKFSANTLSIKRYAIEIPVVFLGGFALKSIFYFLFVKLIVVPEANIDSLEMRLRNLLAMTHTYLMLTYVVITGFNSFKSMEQRKTQVSRLEKEYAQSRFEALQNQLNPHFLFNSLSILSSLVQINADIAEQFIEKLSKTYRYLLDQREKEWVPLKDEIVFLKNYIFLIQQRYADKLFVDINVHHDESALYLIIPNTFLVIMEYIINKTSMSVLNPLHIVVSIADRKVLFSYTGQMKEISGSGVLQPFQQLENRYAQVNKKIELYTNTNTFENFIAIPLIKNNNE